MQQSPPERTGQDERIRAYWRANSRLILFLFVLWLLAGYAHPPFAKALNNITILTGFPLGYYLASQASITIFVLLIFAYALIMNHVIDRKHGFEEEE